MEVSLEVKQGLERLLRVTVPAAELQRQLEERLVRLARSTSLKGFRPGKAPLSLIRKRFAPKLWGEVVDNTLRDSFRDAIKAEKLDPAGTPRLEIKHATEGEELRYEASFDILPEITLDPAEQLEIEQPEVRVDDADVEAMVEELRRRHGSWVAVQRAAQKGDRLRMDYTVRRAGEIFGEPVQGTEVQLGAGMLFPEFEDALHAAEPGARRNVSVRVPESDPRTELRGAQVECDVHVQEVLELRPAPLQQEFFASLGMAEGSEETFRTQVRENMEQERERLTEQYMRRQLVAEYRKRHPFLLPRSLVENEERELHHNFLRSRGMDPSKDNSAPPEGKYLSLARDRVAEFLLLRELVRKSGVQAEEHAVRARVEQLAAGAADRTAFVRACYADERRMAVVRAQLAEEATLQSVLQKVQTRSKAYGFSALQDLLHGVRQPAPA